MHLLESCCFFLNNFKDKVHIFMTIFFTIWHKIYSFHHKLTFFFQIAYYCKLFCIASSRNFIAFYGVLSYIHCGFFYKKFSSIPYIICHRRDLSSVYLCNSLGLEPLHYHYISWGRKNLFKIFATSAQVYNLKLE